ncbi:MAG: protein-L-isoaspartate(D-aspartate) O-methyltransferase [Flavobacteriaceae bacterium]|nr:protein-L-isoaspartate(D-aspartate) O-methyltransferase [Flavobacteriaceae bacterium]MBT7459290.1 protein-L-isoaspartate(D-aspartate) O-methyltransferase [Flavobacteriaceae bacterium]MDG0967455.1 protein-L-isoaspartate(D-aspartate) O-methyltransferase [Flavobacteriaceae bacterium]
MVDSTKHQGMRRHLVEQLRNKGITDERVLSVIAQIPRHLFMDSGFESHAYQDKAFPIAAEQTISQPYTVAFQSQLLEVKPNHNVLEIGTGSGYQTAVLTLLEAVVFSIERQHKLYRYSMRQLPKLGYRPKKLVFGDGYKGLPDHAPFDRILVTAGAKEVPKPLLEQLAIGGRLVIPVGTGTQEMILFVRKSAKEFEKQTHGTFRFVPMLEDKN